MRLGVYLFICLSVYLFMRFALCVLRYAFCVMRLGVWVRVIGCVEIGAGVYTGRFHGRRVGARPGS